MDTNNNLDDKKKKLQDNYSRLDRFLLILLSIELGYYILLIFAGLIVTILVKINNFASDFSNNELNIFIPVLFFIIALPLNMFGGLASIILNLKINHQGYPGTGHLLNWIFLLTTSWLFILSLVFMIPEFLRY
jgi:hypothetical protein